jgi:hypothetical protein
VIKQVAIFGKSYQRVVRKTLFSYENWALFRIFNDYHIMEMQGRNGSIASSVVGKLRSSKLRKGQSFMIYSKDLPSRHAYIEFPEGRIVLVTLKVGEHDFTTIRELSTEENLAIRREFNLEPVSQ